MTDAQGLSKLIVVGDRVLIKPKAYSQKTSTGLYLPPGFKEKEEVQTGFVMKVGPGYPIPSANDEIDEPWKKNEEKIRYIPLQAKEGDLAIFMQKGAVEVMFHGEKYFIVPHHSILLLERDEELFS
ncbi:MAG: co-chaperone GroES family protein [Bacteroidales bacterium]|jgi:chaperonin GroES|nr:co-chaperone GroES [Bacteroidales bacterium]MDI9592674.1 co-chaperone GroES family protein [Bacteroidota bacterium]NLH33946.1 co-chaperone GroES [Lentimicrobium sp.]OQC37005.1 MAG: 10 kDa chaperonin [Bacteroidetes bacterium ADurb.Bin041]MBP7874571.1 co-chaperone GroES [Bacteroidales bacterium]